MNKIPQAISLGIVLAVLWLLLSGHFTLLLLVLGICSVVMAVFLASRMEVVDQEGHPLHLNILETIKYWLWLLKAIFLANIDVCRRILSVDLPISPTVIDIESTQGSDLLAVIYANSITLTPGTVSMSIDGNIIKVHALTKEGAANLETGEMKRRLNNLES
jgi:multicomponent Na+:H+ antiporter subunit E